MSPILDKRLYEEVLGFEVLSAKSGKEANSIEYERKPSRMELLALSEVAWRPKGARDAKEFDLRLQPHIEALRARGINARRDEGDAYEFITN